MVDSNRVRKYAKIPSNGVEFERYLTMLFRDLGYRVRNTPATGDYGADLILTNIVGTKHAIQAKFYNAGSIGIQPIQEVFASLAHWHADDGWVVTNGTFTKAAIKLAHENNVKLVDGRKLNEYIEQALDGTVLEENLKSQADKEGDGDISSAASADTSKAPVQRKTTSENRSPMGELIYQAKEMLAVLEGYATSIRGVLMCYCFNDSPVSQDMEELYMSIKTFRRISDDCVVPVENDYNKNETALDFIRFTQAYNVTEESMERDRRTLGTVKEYELSLGKSATELNERAKHDCIDLKYLEYDRVQITEAAYRKIKDLVSEAESYADFSETLGKICSYGIRSAEAKDNGYSKWYFEELATAKEKPQFSSSERLRVVFDRFEAIMRECDAQRKGSSNRKVSYKPLRTLFRESKNNFRSFAHKPYGLNLLYDNETYENEDCFSIHFAAEGLINVQLEVQRIRADFQKNLDELFLLISKQQQLQASVYHEENERLRKLYENEIAEHRRSFESQIAKYRSSTLGMLKKTREKRILEEYRTIQQINEHWKCEACVRQYVPNLPKELISS